MSQEVELWKAQMVLKRVNSLILKPFKRELKALGLWKRQNLLRHLKKLAEKLEKGHWYVFENHLGKWLKISLKSFEKGHKEVSRNHLESKWKLAWKNFEKGTQRSV